MSVLDPLTHALAAVLAAAHATVTSFGLDPASGLAWLLSIAAIVVVVRLALLPLTVHGVRLAHAGAHARPELRKLTERYRGRTDAESLRAFMAERRQIAGDHGMSRLGCLPLLLQLPVWLALYRLLAEAAAGHSLGAMGATLVASLGAATVAGVHLAERGYLGGGPAHLAVVASLAVVAAAASYVTQRFFVARNTVTDELPEAMARAQALMPTLSAVGLLVAGGVVPVALLVYWACNNLWTLGQSAAIARWWPTPGSPAAARIESSP
ncbi:membrane protein insertase YidC [Nocardioides speluncae]|uniref:membrane protein insertase YidC n=1 Tax=Nocardioides speluncae TaxID=2670337 RepID=UPI000D68B46B|nr:membrane protein insertase YidC [Nocardioides speluncae]